MVWLKAVAIGDVVVVGGVDVPGLAFGLEAFAPGESMRGRGFLELFFLKKRLFLTFEKKKIQLEKP